MESKELNKYLAVYKKANKDLINEFCKLHDFGLELKVDDRDIYCISDMFLKMDNIIEFIEQKISTDDILKWYWYYYLHPAGGIDLKTYLKNKK